MSRLFKRRPSPAMIVGIVALIAALGGGAYAATKKQVTYKTLNKEARLKVLPVSSTKNITADCDPQDAATYVDCASVSFNWSKQFPRKTTLVADGVFTTDADGARGECRLELDNAPIAGTTVKIGENGTGGHQNDNGDGFGINTVTAPQAGAHTYSIACNETVGDFKIRALQMSGFGTR